MPTRKIIVLTALFSFAISITSAQQNVGIGVTNPLRKLDVGGDINFSGDLYKNNVLYKPWATSIDELSDANYDTIGTNLFLGLGSGDSLTGVFNTGVGINVLKSLSGSKRNTALGYHALSSSTFGSDNVAIGFKALELNTLGDRNTAVGNTALASNTEGASNTAIGYAALSANTTGVVNTAVGQNSLGSNTTGQSNTAIGHAALRDNTTGELNTAVGQRAMLLNTIGNKKNTILIVGYAEGRSLAGRLRNGDEYVTIYGKEFKVNAEVKVINSLSAHGDYKEIIRYLSCQDPKQVKQLFLVHGDPEVQIEFKKKLNEVGFDRITIPDQHSYYYI